MKITQAETADLPSILALQYLAYQSEANLLNNVNIPPLKQTLEEVAKEFETGLVLKAQDETGAIIGSVRGYANGNTFYIGKLIVRPDLQGQGIGTKLLKEIEKRSPHERYELFTSSKSVQNIRLYERLGYTQCKTVAVNADLELVYMEKWNR